MNDWRSMPKRRGPRGGGLWMPRNRQQRRAQRREGVERMARAFGVALLPGEPTRALAERVRAARVKPDP